MLRASDRVALKSARQAVYEAARATSRVASLEATYDAAIETAVRDSIERSNDTFITIMVEIDDDHARERAIEDSIVSQLCTCCKPMLRPPTTTSTQTSPSLLTTLSLPLRPRSLLSKPQRLASKSSHNQRITQNFPN